MAASGVEMPKDQANIRARITDNLRILGLGGGQISMWSKVSLFLVVN